MTRFPLRFSRSSTYLRGAFSLVEILCVVCVIALITCIAIPNVGSVRNTVSQTKLSSDVAVLNRAIGLYVAEGGSLDGVVNPVDVLERLKTKTIAADARQHVGPVSGRLVDQRLAARHVTFTEAASNTPRAVWNDTLKKFEIATSGDGIAAFYFDDTKASNPSTTETRKASSMLYNGSEGWVWANGSGGPSGTGGTAAPAFPSPLAPALNSPSSPPSTFGPASSGSLPASLTGLPTPVISPGSGTFEAVSFPTTATISKNGAPSTGSRLVYMIIHGDNTYTSWTTYTGAFALGYGDTVLAYNQSTNSALYVDSQQARGLFIREPKLLPTPTLSPPGGVYANSTFPINVTVSANGAPGGSFSKLKYRVTNRAGTVGAWTNYVSAVTVNYYETLEAKNFGVDTTSYYDSDSVSGTYTPQTPVMDYFAGTVVPRWTDIAGGSSLLSSLLNFLVDDVKATFGFALLGSPPNTLEFQRLAWSNIPPDTDFKIGTFSYYNGTVTSGTEASAITLHLDMPLTKPIVQVGSANARISLWSSANVDNSQTKSADYAQLDNPITDLTVSVNGVSYRLKLRFANVAAEEGWTDGTKLYVYEGSNGHADLIARFVTIP
jgi:type II secretory pathway pseudopilin PulG